MCETLLVNEYLSEKIPLRSTLGFGLMTRDRINPIIPQLLLYGPCVITATKMLCRGWKLNRLYYILYCYDVVIRLSPTDRKICEKL